MAANYTISVIPNAPSGWRYTVRSPKGHILDTRYGYATRSEAEGSAHMWLRKYLAGNPHPHRDPRRRSRRVRRDVVPMPRKHRGVEKDMLLGILEAMWLDSYMSWADENGFDYTTGHIPQHVRSLKDIPQAPPLAAKKLAKKYASILVKMNRASLTQIYDRAWKAEERAGRGDYVDPVKLGFYLAMQSRGHGVGWTDDHEAFPLVLPTGEWYAYGKKGRVGFEGYVSERHKTRLR